MTPASTLQQRHRAHGEPSTPVRATQRNTPSWAQGDQGSATVWLVLFFPIFILVTAILIDLGGSVAARQEAAGLAREAARAAVDSIDPDDYRSGIALSPRQAVSAVTSFCSSYVTKGSGTTCTTTVGANDVVTVEVSQVHNTTGLRLLGVGPMTVRASAVARPSFGVINERVPNP